MVLPKIPQISDPPSQFRSSVSRFDSTSTSSPPISRSCFVMESLESHENASWERPGRKNKRKRMGSPLEFPCEWFFVFWVNLSFFEHRICECGHPKWEFDDRNMRMNPQKMEYLQSYRRKVGNQLPNMGIQQQETAKTIFHWADPGKKNSANVSLPPTWQWSWLAMGKIF